MNFFTGLKVFFNAMGMCFSKDVLWDWYKKISVKSFGISILILICFIVAGSMGLTKLIAGLIAESIWASLAIWAVNILWVVAIIYFSGMIASSISIALVGVLFDEKKLMQKFCGDNFVWTKAKSKDYFKEYSAIAISIGVSLFTLLWFFIPPLIPFAILFNAWAMGKESLAFANRLWHQAGETTVLDDAKGVSWLFVMGIGTFTSAILLLPIFGWLFLPVLQVAGVVALRPEK